MKLNRMLNQQSWQEVKRFEQDDSFGCCLGAETQRAVSPYAARRIAQRGTLCWPTQHVESADAARRVFEPPLG